jgi:hypothetical protein
MRRFINAQGGREIWIDPAAVILAEPHEVTHLRGQDTWSTDDTRLLLTTGGSVYVTGTLRDTLDMLGVTA